MTQKTEIQIVTGEAASQKKSQKKSQKRVDGPDFFCFSSPTRTQAECLFRVKRKAIWLALGFFRPSCSDSLPLFPASPDSITANFVQTA